MCAIIFIFIKFANQMRKTQYFEMHIIPFSFNLTVKAFVDHNNYNIFNALLCSNILTTIKKNEMAQQVPMFAQCFKVLPSGMWCYILVLFLLHYKYVSI